MNRRPIATGVRRRLPELCVALALAFALPRSVRAGEAPPLELRVIAQLFGDNTEFFGPFRTGETQAGGWLRAFLRWPLSEKADLLVYSGHSGLGKNINALAAKGKVAKGKYQLVYLNGCQSFAYLGTAMHDKHTAANGKDVDPDGTKYLDVVANALPAYGDDGATSLTLYRAMLDFHIEQRAQATVAVVEHHVHVPYGVIETNGFSIRSQREKPDYTYFINAGFYVIGRELASLVPPSEPFDMPDLIDIANRRKLKSVVYPVSDFWIDIGRPEDLDAARTMLAKVDI